MRWARYAIAVGLVGLSLTVAAPAQAFQPPVLDPVRFPGSTLKGGAPDMTPKEWNRFLKQHPELRPTGRVGNWAKGGLRGGGQIMAGIFGLSIGTHIAEVFGLDTSGDFFCDLATLVASSDCGVVAHPEYVPNSDLGTAEPGWLGGSNQWVSIEGTTALGTWIAQVSAYEVPYGHGVNVEWALDTTYPNWRPGMPMSLYCVNPASGALSPSVFQRVSPLIPAESPWQNAMGCAGSTSVPVAVVIGGLLDIEPTTLHDNFVAPTGRTWVAPEHPLWSDPAEAELTWWETTWRCDAAAPQTSSSRTFNESDAEWPAFPSAECNPGAVITSMLVQQMSNLGVRDTIIDWELDQTGIDWNTDYPQCADGSCILDLMRIDPQTDKRLSCFSNPALCWDWFEDPNKADKFECRYGGTVVALKECNVYRPTFPNPDTGKKPDYADPDPENPDPPVVHVPPQPEPLPPLGSPRPDNSCPPPFTWLSAINPWWHFKSFTCGLQEMFVPSGNVDFSGVNAAWRGSALGQIQTTFGDPLGFGGVLINPGGVTCGVIVDVEVPILAGQNLVVDTCTGIWQEAGGVRTVVAAGFIIAGVLGGVWVILGTVRVRVGAEGNST